MFSLESFDLKQALFGQCSVLPCSDFMSVKIFAVTQLVNLFCNLRTTAFSSVDFYEKPYGIFY
jgi:hypothetical protein